MTNAAPNPFGAATPERTIIKPRPQGRAGAPMAASAASVAPGAAEVAGELHLLNPLVSAAGRLLLLGNQLRHLAQTPDATALRAAAADAVQQFDIQARRAGISNETVVAARYVLCTALDEAAANTPWGVAAGWNKQSLLVQFHNETWGGEKVFQLLAKLAQDVSTHRALLELIYAVLGLGFEGRYRVLENGRAQLDALRARLAELLRKDRPDPSPELSSHWRGEAAGAMRLRDTVPLWVIATAFALALALAWVGVRLWLNHRSDAIWSAIAELRAPAAPVAASAPMPVPAPVSRLARFLEPEIKQGLVTVTDTADRSTVRLRGDSVFASGQAEPMATALPLLRRIGQALAQTPGQTLITGHSDNQPIRSLRFPSNWHLSTARAQAVMKTLAEQVEVQRMRADGRADAEPVASNDTADGRARNRRVEIVLMTGAAK